MDDADTTLQFKVPDHLEFGSAPRCRYPLVVFVLLKDALDPSNFNSIVRINFGTQVLP